MSNTDYLDYIEDDRDYEGFCKFEKVIAAAQRARTLYDRGGIDDHMHKPSYRALKEINDGKVSVLNPAHHTENDPTAKS